MDRNLMRIVLVVLCAISPILASSPFSSEEEAQSDQWTGWTSVPLESDTERATQPLDATTIALATEIVTFTASEYETAAPDTEEPKMRTTTPEDEQEEETVRVSSIRPTTSSKSASTKPTSSTTSTTRTTTTTTTTTEASTVLGLSEFLKRRKHERFLATTEVDPFIAILATATPPSSSSGESTTEREQRATISPAINQRFSNRRKNSSFGKSSSPIVRPTTPRTSLDVPPVRVIGNRLSPNLSLKRKNSFGRSSTTQRSVIDEPRLSFTTTRPRFIPKRPSLTRPIGNGISRKEITTTSSEDGAFTDQPEVSSPRAPLRRANSRLFRASRL